MKNQNGAISYHTFGTRNKVVVFLSALLVGVAAFLLLSPAVYASAPDPLPIDANVVPVTVSPQTEYLYHSLRANGFVFGDQYYYSLDYDTVNDVYSFSGSPNSGSFKVLYEGTVTINQQYTGINSGSFYTYLYGNKSSNLTFTVANSTSVRQELIDYDISANYDLNSAFAQWGSNGSNNSNVSIYYSAIQQNVPSYFQLSINLNYKLTVTFSFNGNFVNKVLTALDTTAAVSNSSSTNNINCYQSDYNYTDIMQALDYKLYMIWSQDVATYNLIMSKLSDLHYDLITLYNRLGNIYDTLVNHSSTNHADLVAILDALLEDDSGGAAAIQTEAAAIESEHAVAESAMEEAIPQYETQLGRIEHVNVDSFFTSQNSAIMFWKYIVDQFFYTDVFGPVATALTIVTLVGLFVYLLRL